MTASEPPDDPGAGSPRTPIDGDSLTRSTVTGLKWTYLGTASMGVMQVVYTAVMSRLLTPRLFGIFAIATLAVMFGQYFAQMGLGQAVVQKAELSRDEIRASWTSGVALGLIVTLLGVVTAPLIGELFNEPDAVPVLQVMSLSYLILGVQLTSRSLLRRQMRFRVLALSEATGFLVGFLGVGIGMALAGAGVWSLVGANLGSRVVGTVLKFIAVPHSIRPTWRWDHYRDLYSFGVRSSGIQLLEFASNNLDTIAVARFAAADILGQYNRAFYLVNLPLNYLRDSLSQVLFPGFSRLQDQPERLRRVFVGASSVAGVVVLPVAAGVGVAANEVVGVVMGDQWQPAATVVPFLAVAAALSVMSRFAGIAIEAVADLNRKLMTQAIYVMVLAGLMVAAGGRAIWYYGLALALGEVVRSTLFLWLMVGAVGLRGRDVGRIFLPGAWAALVVGTTIGLSRWGLLTVGAPLWVRFFVAVTVGAITLLILLRTRPLRAPRRELLSRLQRSGILRSDRVRRVVELVVGSR